MSNFPPPPPAGNFPPPGGYTPPPGNFPPPGAYPNAPIGYGHGGFAPVAQKPGVITALGVCGIIVGGLGLLCHGATALLYIVPAAQLVQRAGEILPLMILFTVGSWILSIVLLVGAIGALSLKPWARRLLLIYAIAQLPLSIIGLGGDFYLSAPMLTSHSGPTGFAAGFFVGLILRAVILIGLPIWTLVVLTQARVRQAFGELPKAM